MRGVAQAFSDLLEQYVNVVLGLPLQAPLERSSYGQSAGNISANEFDDYSPKEKLAGSFPAAGMARSKD